MGITVIVGTVKGAFILRSDDGRSDWAIEGPIFKGWKVTASARAPDGRFLVGTASQVYGPAIQVSDDLADWTQAQQSPAYAEGGDRKLTQIWTITTSDRGHWAGVDEAGLFHSADGLEWSPVPGLNEHETRGGWHPGAGGLCAHSVILDPGNPDRIWCGISAVGVFRSDDGGETWHAKNDGVRVILEDENFKDIGFCVHGLALDPTDSNKLYRQDHVGMYRSSDAGDTWERVDTGVPSGFGFPIAIDNATGTLFAVPLESDEYRMPPDGKMRVIRSRDGGSSWEHLGEGLPAENVYANVLRGAVDTDHLSPCGVYVGTTSGTVHVSNDDGDSWRSLPCVLPRILSVDAFVES